MAKNDATWMVTAQSQIGTKEYPGASSNPKIMQWAGKVGKMMGMKYDGDHVPWCGLFAAYIMVENGIIPPSIAVRASAWSTWGVALAKPSFGAILTFTREGGGHVGFYVSEDATNYHVLGGNQGDAVNITKIAKSRCSAIRWPGKYGLPTSGPIVKNRDGTVSKNEA